MLPVVDTDDDDSARWLFGLRRAQIAGAGDGELRDQIAARIADRR